MLDRIAAALGLMSSGDLSFLGGPIMKEDVAGRVRAEQINVIFQHLPLMMLANATSADIFVAAFRASRDWNWALAWAAVIVAYSIFFGIRSVGKRQAKPTVVSKRTVRRALRNALLFGSLWAAMPLIFFASASSGERLIVTCLCAGILGGGALAFASIPAAAIAFVTPIIVASGLVIARNGDEAFYLAALLMVVYTCILLGGAFVYAFKLASRFVAQVEAEIEVRKDALTRLSNRTAFQEHVESALSRLVRTGEPFALFYLDLNDFKAVNDKMGHAAGDVLLQQIADRLRSDQRDNDCIARLAGDEFALVAANVGRPEDALAVGQQIVRAIDVPFEIDGTQVASSVTIGIALAPHDGTDFVTLVKNADTALYQAKRNPGEPVRIFDPRCDENARDRRAIGNDLRYAIERQELHLVFQPLLSLQEDRIVGCEALLRWTHPTRGSIPPLEFVGIAEEMQLIHSIGEWAIREACLTAATWPQDIRIAVNCSGIQLRKSAILSSIVNALADAGIAPFRLEIEVTESVLISEDEIALETLSAAHHLGVQLALDDFGTGYSSLNYLGKAPFDRIKIDQSFTRDLLTNPDRTAIVKSLIGLARDLRMSVTAEGVETIEQLSRLRAMNCSEAQGSLIGTPKTAAEIAELLKKQSSVGRLRLARA